jgi:hypothetical protein
MPDTQGSADNRLEPVSSWMQISSAKHSEAAFGSSLSPLGKSARAWSCATTSNSGCRIYGAYYKHRLERLVLPWCSELVFAILFSNAHRLWIITDINKFRYYAKPISETGCWNVYCHLQSNSCLITTVFIFPFSSTLCNLYSWESVVK